MPGKIRVLVIDDSALVREILSTGLQADPDIEVVGTAVDPFQARDKIVECRPNVLTLDVEMPRMDGVQFLRQLMPQYPLPVVMVSALTERGKRITVEALEAGAVDFVAKPKSDVARGLNAMIGQLREKVKMASLVNVQHLKGKRPITRDSRRETTSESLAESTHKVVVIGASTGGTEAIREVILGLPATSCGCVIVQHMPSGFTKIFAERLNEVVAMQVSEATDGDTILPGRVLIAPGGQHLRVLRSGGIYRVKIEPGEKVCGHCPSVEVLMQSAAKSVGANALGIMLTGMGGDGAQGLLAMHKAGALTLAQDEATCVVFGMPKVAWELGAVNELLPLSKIANATISWQRQEERV